MKKLLSLPLDGRIASCKGGDCFLVVGHFTLAGKHAGVLLGMLPPVVRLRTEPERTELRWLLSRMSRALRAQRPGARFIAQHLAHLLLARAIRLHLERGPRGVGGLFALADEQLNAALQAMHGDPARPWTLQALAERAGMSRTVFAARFKEKVGSSVMQCLGRGPSAAASRRETTASERRAVSSRLRTRTAVVAPRDATSWARAAVRPSERVIRPAEEGRRSFPVTPGGAAVPHPA